MEFKKFDWIGRQEFSAVKRVMRSKQLSGFYGNWGEKFEGGKEVIGFERECEEYFEIKHAITFNSLASGLSAAIGALGIGPGDQVILPPWTMSASAAAILHWGGIPVFADIDERTYCIDPKSVESLVNSRTKAIIAVDIFGQSSNIEQLKRIAHKFNLKIVSDTAQAIGATRHNKYAGTLADIGGISLNYHKHIHTGEGAVMFTNDDNLALRLKLIRNHAEAVVGDIPFEVNLVNMVGHNYRLSEIQAAIGREQLKKLTKITSTRKTETDLLRRKLIKFEEIIPPFVDDGNTHVFYMYAMQLKLSNLTITKSQFVQELKKLGVPGLSDKYINLHLLPIFQNKIAIGKHGFPWTYDQSSSQVSYTKGICPVAEKLQDETYFSFYINDYFITKSEVSFIYRSFEKVIQKYSRSS